MKRDWLRARSGGGVESRFVGRLWESFRCGSIGVYAERSLCAGVCTALAYSSWRCHTQVDGFTVSQIGSKATFFPFKSRCGLASIVGSTCCLIVPRNSIALRRPRLREVHCERHQLPFTNAVPQPIRGNCRNSMLRCKRWLRAGLDNFLANQN